VRRLIVLFGWVAPVITIAMWSTSPLAAVGVLMVSHALLLYPTLVANAQWLGPVITSFETEKKELWLTIDDGPSADTAELLDVLDARAAKATFFVKGSLAEKNEELVREILERGHTVANHSYSHPSFTFWCLLPGAVRREIERCNTVLSSITSSPTRLFRAPVGMKNPAVHPVLKRHGMDLIGWTARAFDTTTHDPDVVINRLMPAVKPGAIVVLHQGRSSSVNVITRVLDELQGRGYTFVIPEPGRLKTNM
jgi:peptidoglycan/xylan/chitin deacetylase (PgdA/CDA1 family)